MDEQLIPVDKLGHIDRELPLRIGEIAMLAALLEHKIGALAGAVENKPQRIYFRRSFARNAATCRSRLPLFTEPYERPAVEKSLAALTVAERVLEARHAVVHRVWARAAGPTWGGYKGSDDPSRPTAWDDYPADQLRELVSALAAAVDQVVDALGEATGLHRIEDPLPAVLDWSAAEQIPSRRWASVQRGDRLELKAKRSKDRTSVVVEKVLPRNRPDGRGIIDSEGAEYREFYWDLTIWRVSK